MFCQGTKEFLRSKGVELMWPASIACRRSIARDTATRVCRSARAAGITLDHARIIGSALSTFSAVPAAKSCPTPQVSFAPLLPVEDAFVGGSLLAPRIALDVGGPPDCRPSRVALRI